MTAVQISTVGLPLTASVLAGVLMPLVRRSPAAFEASDAQVRRSSAEAHHRWEGTVGVSQSEAAPPRVGPAVR